MNTQSWSSCRRWLLAASLLLCTCGAPTEREIGQLEHLDGERPALGPFTPPDLPAQHRPPPAQPERLAVLGFSADQQLTLFDSVSGQRLDVTPALTLGGDRDLAWDQLGRRALVFVGEPDEQAGAIHTVPVRLEPPGEPTLGEIRHRAWVDGRARLWPAHHGMVVFEEGYGQRWKLLRDDGVPTASVAAPRPASVWHAPAASGRWLGALSYDDSGGPPQLTMLSAWIDGEGIEPPAATPLQLEPLSAPPSARLTPVEGPGRDSGSAEPAQAILVDVRAGVPVLRLLGAGAEPARLTVSEAAPVERVEQTLMLPGSYGGNRRAVASLLSSPSRLLVVSFGPGLTAPEVAVAELPGQIRMQDLFFGRDLLALGSRRLLAATDEGVWAVSVQSGPRGSWLELDEHFAGGALRGPLAGPVGRLP